MRDLPTQAMERRPARPTSESTRGRSLGGVRRFGQRRLHESAREYAWEGYLYRDRRAGMLVLFGRGVCKLTWAACRQKTCGGRDGNKIELWPTWKRRISGSLNVPLSLKSCRPSQLPSSPVFYIGVLCPVLQWTGLRLTVIARLHSRHYEADSGQAISTWRPSKTIDNVPVQLTPSHSFVLVPLLNTASLFLILRVVQESRLQ